MKNNKRARPDFRLNHHVVPPQTHAAASRERISLRTTSTIMSLFSTSTQMGDDVIFTSGKVGLNDENKLEKTFEDQCRSALRRVAKAVRTSGGSIASACMINVYLVDMSMYGRFNDIYCTFLKEHNADKAPPCRACVAVMKLPFDAEVEVECAAVLTTSKRRVVRTDSEVPFSDVVIAGRREICWTSGQISQMDTPDVKHQSIEALENLKRALSLAGSSPSRTMKITVYLTDINDYSKMNDAYREVFLSDVNDPPARAAFSVRALPLGRKVEVCAIASLSTDSPSSLIAVQGASAVPVYSPAMVLGDEFVFCSGQIALDPSSGTKALVGAGDVAKETEQALKNMRAVLREGGASMSSVRKVNIFLTDMSQYDKVNEVYKRFFGGSKPPARTCVEVRDLPCGAMIEIECKAERPSRLGRAIAIGAVVIALGIGMGLAFRFFRTGKKSSRL